ncbi:hypothetical protein RQP46_005829 [Phenoliferia psychrophenolica]
MDFFESLEEACKGGVTIVQLREKNITTRELLEIGTKAKLICDKYNVPLVINDRLDVALALSCGLHVGQSDMQAHVARALLGRDQILGISVGTEEEMNDVLREGVVDYVGLGPAYMTQSKKIVGPILGTRGVTRLLGVLGNSSIKAVVIGGVSEITIPNVLTQCAAPLDKGYRTLDGIAVVSAISASREPQESARRLLKLFRAGSSRPFPLDHTVLSPDSQAAKALEVIELACSLLVKLRHGPNPLIHHITNDVVMNGTSLKLLEPPSTIRRLTSASLSPDTANLTLAFGGSPIMSGFALEAAEFSTHIAALVINLGTLSIPQCEAHMQAGLAAKRNGKPVIFDPVGVGATSFRRGITNTLCSDVHMNIIKGNAAEIGALTGSLEVQTRGVDSVGPGFKDPSTIVRNLARREKLTVAMSGAIDYVSDGNRTYMIENGHHYQSVITGSGCMATSAVAVFAAISDPAHPESYTMAAVAGYVIKEFLQARWIQR